MLQMREKRVTDALRCAKIDERCTVSGNWQLITFCIPQLYATQNISAFYIEMSGIFSFASFINACYIDFFIHSRVFQIQSISTS